MNTARKRQEYLKTQRHFNVNIQYSVWCSSVAKKTAVFREVAGCILLETCRRYGRICCLYLIDLINFTISTSFFALLVLFLTSSILPFALNYPLSKSVLYKTVSYWSASPFIHLNHFTSRVTCPSALIMEIADSSETSVPVCQNIRRHKADDTSGFFYTLLLCSVVEAFILCFMWRMWRCISGPLVIDVSNEHIAFICKDTGVICILGALEGEDSTLPRNVGHQLPIVAASHLQKNGTFYLAAGRISKHGCDMLVVPKMRDKDGSRGFRFVRLEALHGKPQKTKCVILWTQVACVLMTGCRCSDGACETSFVAQGIVRSCGGQHHATVVRYLGGLNDVLPASPTFLIRFGQRSVQAVSANIYRVTKGFVKIRPIESHAFRRNLNEFHVHSGAKRTHFFK